MHKFKTTLKGLLLAVALLSSSATAILAQTPSLLWQKTYGSQINQEFGYASIKLNNNLYVHGGRHSIPFTTNSGVFLLFANANGDSLYSQIYHSIMGGRINGMAANDDGTFVAIG